MKDKLMKYGHKKAYYRFRSFGKAFAFIAALAVGSALPIFVVANASSTPATAQEAVDMSDADLDVVESIEEISSSL